VELIVTIWFRVVLCRIRLDLLMSIVHWVGRQSIIFIIQPVQSIILIMLMSSRMLSIVIMKKIMMMKINDLISSISIHITKHYNLYSLLYNISIMVVYTTLWIHTINIDKSHTHFLFYILYNWTQTRFSHIMNGLFP